MRRSDDKVEVMIATPLEEELAARIEAADDRIRLLYEPELLPPPRYVADHKGDPAFRRDEQGERRWREMLGHSEVLFGAPGESAEGLEYVLTHGQRLRWVQATNAGTGQQIKESGIRLEVLDEVAVTTASGVHATPLAEFALLGMLHFAKQLPKLARFQRDRHWERLHFRELRNMRLLVVGLGSIGREVARLGNHLGMRVTGIKRDPSITEPGVERIYPPEQLTEVISDADAVVVTLPLTSETAELVGREAIDAMKSDAIFVNVGRGGVVDEEALLGALENSNLAGAALDVYREEPLPTESRLWDLPNVILSPHSAASSESENERIVDLFIQNLGRYLAGEPLVNRLRPNHLY